VPADSVSSFIGAGRLSKDAHVLSLTPNDGESRQTRRDLDLHVDRAGLDPLKGYGGNPLDHAALPQSKVAELGEEGKNIKGT
jgi:hypothetical protein